MHIIKKMLNIRYFLHNSKRYRRSLRKINFPLIFKGSTFFNYHSLPNAIQLDYHIINLIIVLRFLLLGFYSGGKTTDKNFWSDLILVG